MVSFWPWKGGDASPASFEKALSALATKIANTQAKLDRTRSTSRRVRVLCTLYLSFGYLVYAIVLVLVVGWKNMGAWEWSGVTGGPLLIYALRTALAAYYNFRIDSLSSKLKEQQAERAKTIQKLKDATKYDSTLQLLEKYGDGETTPGKGKSGEGSGAQPGGRRGKRGAAGGPGGGPGGGGDAAENPSTPNRTRLPPPPTANIQHGGSAQHTPRSKQNTPRAGEGRTVAGFPSPNGGEAGLDISAEFAPNAFGSDALVPSSSPSRTLGGQYAPAPATNNSGAFVAESHWYDRILDLLMGDDETAAKNRFVLICSSCRLVNGQAPPGTRSLAEIGSWRCMGCGASNGEVAEAKKIVSEVLGKQAAVENEASSDGDDSDVARPVVSEGEEDGEETKATGKDTISGDRKSVRKRSKAVI